MTKFEIKMDTNINDTQFQTSQRGHYEADHFARPHQSIDVHVFCSLHMDEVTKHSLIYVFHYILVYRLFKILDTRVFQK